MMYQFRTVDRDGYTTRFVEFDHTTGEGTVYYGRGSVRMLTDPMGLWSTRDLEDRLHGWMFHDHQTIVQGWE